MLIMSWAMTVSYNHVLVVYAAKATDKAIRRTTMMPTMTQPAIPIPIPM